jgi:hypothetical protein
VACLPRSVHGCAPWADGGGGSETTVVCHFLLSVSRSWLCATIGSEAMVLRHRFHSVGRGFAPRSTAKRWYCVIVCIQSVVVLRHDRQRRLSDGIAPSFPFGRSWYCAIVSIRSVVVLRHDDDRQRSDDIAPSFPFCRSRFCVTIGSEAMVLHHRFHSVGRGFAP